MRIKAATALAVMPVKERHLAESDLDPGEKIPELKGNMVTFFDLLMLAY